MSGNSPDVLLAFKQQQNIHNLRLIVQDMYAVCSALPVTTEVLDVADNLDERRIAIF